MAAPDDMVIQRLTQHKEITEAQILARLRSQMPAEEKTKYADAIIYNDGDISQLESRITELWRKLSII